MTKKRKVLMGLIILDVIIIGVAIFLTINLIKIKNEEKNPKNEIVNKIENNTVNNAINNTVKNNVVNNTVKNKVEEDEHKHDEKIADPEQEVDKATMQNRQSNEEKAISIAKEAWGEDSSVEFTFDHIDEDGRYVVFVRSIETTRQIDAYTIDIEAGKVVE